MDITDQAIPETEQKNRDNLLRRSLKIGRMGYWSLDFANQKLDWSDEVYDIFGMDKTEGIATYEDFIERVHPDDREYVDREWLRAVKGERIYDITHRILTEEKDKKIVREYAEFSHGNDGRPIFAEGIIQDITEQHLLAEQLHQSEKMQAVGQLAGGVAHDFNNQLAAILGYAKMLQDHDLGGKLDKYVQNIVVAGERAADLTTQLLAFSRKGNRRSEVIDLHEIIAEVLALIDRSFDKKICVETRLVSARPLTLGDPSLMQNAILNLCLNARDAMPEGGTLTIGTRDITVDYQMKKSITRELEYGEYIVLSVEDTGSGMTQDVKSSIFEPYFTTKGEGKGTGMGLAAVFGTVKEHGGCIRFYSESGAGTVFNLYLPKTNNELQAPANNECNGAVCGTGTIMVIDDEEMVREMTCDILQSYGYTTIAVDSPDKAIELYREQKNDIDLVILDMIMPDRNGAEVFEQLRQINGEAKVIIISGFSAGHDTQKLLENGAVHFVEKPFTPSELSQAVCSVLCG